MGNREDLLAGAKSCLIEKGYARTTVRDIASAAGVSMAAIGYHYGSKEALMNAALVDLSGKELGDAIEDAIAAAASSPTPLERFAVTWDRMTAAFSEHRRLLAASLENMGQLERVPEVRDALAEGQRMAVAAMAETLAGADPHLEPVQARRVAGLYYTILNGLMMQWLVDPGTTPTGTELAEALSAVTAAPAGT